MLFLRPVTCYAQLITNHSIGLSSTDRYCSVKQCQNMKSRTSALCSGRPLLVVRACGKCAWSDGRWSLAGQRSRRDICLFQTLLLIQNNKEKALQ